MKASFRRCDFMIVMLLVASLVTSEARADYTLYTIPGTPLRLTLPGRVSYNPGGTATHRHPRGTLYFRTQDIKVLKSDTPKAIFGRRLVKVRDSNDVDGYLDLARWALHNGLLDESKSLLSAAWKVDSSHLRLRKLAGLMGYINRPVQPDPEGEQSARRLIGGQKMIASRSRHFLLLHDRYDEKDKVSRKTRAEMRLDLLEKVYESYFLTFAFEGLFLRPPTKPLFVVLFRDHENFMLLERRLEMSLKQTAGFYSPKENISIFYDSGTSPQFKQLMQLSQEMERMRDEAKRIRTAASGNLIRMAKTLELLVDIERESEDVSVVSHEAVHQLAANTDLFPRDGPFIRWVHEGLASFFESAKLAQWSGIGAVDLNRIGYYRILEPDPIRGSIEFIVSDLGFRFETVLGNQLPAYGQAWALTHFLFHRHFDKLIAYYRKLEEIPVEEIKDIEVLKKRSEQMIAIFDEVFGDRAALEIEWRRYMRSLKTDIERLAEGRQ